MLEFLIQKFKCKKRSGEQKKTKKKQKMENENRLIASKFQLKFLSHSLFNTISVSCQFRRRK